jgi:hypothetical protein
MLVKIEGRWNWLRIVSSGGLLASVVLKLRVLLPELIN